MAGERGEERKGPNRGRDGKTLNVSVHQRRDVWAMVVSVVTKRTANRLRKRHFVLFRGMIWFYKYLLECFIEMHSVFCSHSVSMCVCLSVCARDV